MTSKEAAKISYEIVGLLQGLETGVFNFLETSSIVGGLANVSPKVLDTLRFYVENDTQVEWLASCGVVVERYEDEQ